MLDTMANPMTTQERIFPKDSQQLDLFSENQKGNGDDLGYHLNFPNVDAAITCP
ncbi:MAG: hypothetical protein MZV49_13515 [Rhodopseudomonas palustris]|nr:hypothetical protein [Rhodopseudomonas palustris]